MNTWLGPCRVSVHMRRRPVGGEQRAASLSRGWQCANRGELLLYPLFYSSSYSPMFFYAFPLFASLIHFVAHHRSLLLHCQFSRLSDFRCLYCWVAYLVPVVKLLRILNAKSVFFFQNIEHIWLPWFKRLWNLHGGIIGCVDGYVYVTACASELGRDEEEFGHMYDGFTHIFWDCLWVNWSLFTITCKSKELLYVNMINISNCATDPKTRNAKLIIMKRFKSCGGGQSPCRSYSLMWERSGKVKLSVIIFWCCPNNKGLSHAEKGNEPQGCIQLKNKCIPPDRMSHYICQQFKLNLRHRGYHSWKITIGLFNWLVKY